MPRISVVIPTYNQSDFLKVALRSLIDQTMTDWEAIVVDNNSDDDTASVVADFNDPRIRYMTLSNEGIIAKSRNAAIREAQGKWIAFLDSDDWWHTDKLQHCLNIVENMPEGRGSPESIDVLAHDMMIMGDNGTSRYHRVGPQSRANPRNILLVGTCATPSAAIVRRTALLDVNMMDERAIYRTAEDFEMWLKLSLAGKTFFFLNEPLTYYRLHSGGASKRTMVHMEASLAIVADYRARIDDGSFGFAAGFRKRLAQIYHGSARGWLAAADLKQAFWAARKAVVQWPLYGRTYITLFQIFFQAIFQTLVGRKKHGP